MNLKSLSKVDLPREKFEKYGPQKLKDYEILAILLGSGIQGTNVLELSKKILKVIEAKGREKIILEDFLAVKGLGRAKATLIMASLEFGTRMSAEKAAMLSPQDVWNACPDIRSSKKEHLVAFYLDTQDRVIDRQILSIGILDANLVHPREVFEPALKLSAASVVLAHNHPSGSMFPSPEDIEMTKTLMHAGKILGIFLVDHVIVSASSYVSFVSDCGKNI